MPLLKSSLLLVVTLGLAHAHPYSAHVSVNTPARSYSHSIGHFPPPNYQNGGRFGAQTNHDRYAKNVRLSGVYSTPSNHPRGYPRVRPSIPFFQEDVPRTNAASFSPPWPRDYLARLSEIPLLPASPYQVDSPNPESLWPDGLFLPPTVPLKGFLREHPNTLDRSDEISDYNNNDVNDPYLLEGSEAVHRVAHIKRRGELFFDNIRHAKSLQENNRLRVENNLPPHRYGSLRPTSPFYRLKL